MMTALAAAPAIVLAAYLLGSLPFAVIVSRAFGLADPRSYGSKNPGATNVLRSGNKLAAALTLSGDAAKGWLAVWLAQRLEFGPETVALAALAALLGHVFPLFLRFKGGKGVATALGALLALSGALAVAAAGTWLLVAAITRYSSLAAIIAALVAPIAGWALLDEPALRLGIACLALILIWRHRSNIAKLLAGTEGRIGEKKAAAGEVGQPPR
jgi:glycerol-3-phosphate acyltransferase PlsY